MLTSRSIVRFHFRLLFELEAPGPQPRKRWDSKLDLGFETDRHAGIGNWSPARIGNWLRWDWKLVPMGFETGAPRALETNHAGSGN